ncbi:hypothetical protein FOA52_009958 [Chlamydomonas sp. UWO 241]|nr:hypothetical protein FOA52_009958 [Chlamydomonas sp. UWO 241]
MRCLNAQTRTAGAVRGPNAPIRAAASYRSVVAPSASPVTRCESVSVSHNVRRRVALAAQAPATPTGAHPPRPNESTGKFISRTEVPAFIFRDDMMDQLFQWSNIEAGESGFRNFGMPMTVDPMYDGPDGALWGFNIGIFKDGVKLTTLSVGFDFEVISKAEWVGRNDEGFPTMEGNVESVTGKMMEIWKADQKPVTEDLRKTIRNYCQGLVGSLNRYYAFGSVFVDDERG